jgi:hypothetical protein
VQLVAHLACVTLQLFQHFSRHSGETDRHKQCLILQHPASDSPLPCSLLLACS